MQDFCVCTFMANVAVLYWVKMDSKLNVVVFSGAQNSAYFHVDYIMWNSSWKKAYIKTMFKNSAQWWD